MHCSVVNQSFHAAYTWYITCFIAILCTINPAITQAAMQIVNISVARRLPLGTIVTISGTVTVNSGTFRSGARDEGFAIQDRTAGLYVSLRDNPDYSVLYV
jgi:hypothetical protein